MYTTKLEYNGDKIHDDVIKWKHFPLYWPFVQGIHRSTVNSPHKGQWRGALMFSLMCARINSWVNNREAGDLRRYRLHDDVIVINTRWNVLSAAAFHCMTAVFVWSQYQTMLLKWPLCQVWKSFVPGVLWVGLILWIPVKQRNEIRWYEKIYRKGQ